MTDTLLSVKNLTLNIPTGSGTLHAVRGIDFDLKRGETLSIVGESGSGKSLTSLAVMGLLGKSIKRQADEMRFDNVDLQTANRRVMRDLRGNRIAMIFQEPMTSLNPVFTTGEQVAEALRLHQGKSKKEALDTAIEMFKLVGIPSPEQRVHNYPHQMSGGMRQRVMIAMALACKPDLLIADEPTTALDVTIQAQILELLRGLQDELGMSIMLITHDLGVVAETCDRVVVMYAGKVAEYTDVYRLFEKPAHPYSKALFESLPDLDGARGVLPTIPGMVPSAQNFPEGCRFRDRCKYADSLCLTEPSIQEIEHGHFVACHHIDKVRAASQEGQA